jgi:hypothetical protein
MAMSAIRRENTAKPNLRIPAPVIADGATIAGATRFSTATQAHRPGRPDGIGCKTKL